jgi:subtilisin family serine protease
MNDKRQYDDSRTPFLRWFWELPPLIRVVLVVLVLLALLFAFLPKSLFHSFNCQVQNVPQNYLSSNGYFIDNQVIVVGQREDIEKVIATSTPVTPTPTLTSTPTSATVTTPATAITLSAVATPAVSGTPATPQPPVPTSTATTGERVVLNRIEGCDLSYLNYRKDRDSGAAVETGKLVMLLYDIPSTGKSVADTISDINAAATAIAKQNNVQPYDISVDPNYLTRLSDSTDDPCGLPSDPGGGGGKGSAGGVPGTLSHSPYDPIRAEDDFINQWAFGSQGINLPNPSTFANTGSGVRVGVFDTSPYRISFHFTKRLTEAFPSPLSFENWDAGGTTMMSSHGLFVASLIHRVAPRSSIQLVRVLNEDGCGQLWVLNKGLEEYISRMSRGSGKLNKTVINMSLGIRVPEANSQSNAELAKLANKEIGTLKKLIKQADQMSAIVVAAAGNDSTNTVSDGVKVKPMQFPARFDKVIGVVATNPSGERSCYSNKAHGPDDVAAPGGEDGTDPRDPDNLCVSRAASWDVITHPPDICHDADIENCKYGLISLVQTRYGPQYMLWSGTSFAAPLVSGMAALAYQKLEKKQAICLIHGGTPSATTSFSDLGTGIINIGNNLTPTVIQQCLHP